MAESNGTAEDDPRVVAQHMKRPRRKIDSIKDAIFKLNWEEQAELLFRILEDTRKNPFSELVANKLAKMVDTGFNIATSRRNRKSDPETIRRNVAICDYHREHPKLSNGQLGKKYDLPREY